MLNSERLISRYRSNTSVSRASLKGVSSNDGSTSESLSVRIRINRLHTLARTSDNRTKCNSSLRSALREKKLTSHSARPKPSPSAGRSQFQIFGGDFAVLDIMVRQYAKNSKTASIRVQSFGYLTAPQPTPKAGRFGSLIRDGAWHPTAVQVIEVMHYDDSTDVPI